MLVVAIPAYASWRSPSQHKLIGFSRHRYYFVPIDCRSCIYNKKLKKGMLMSGQCLLMYVFIYLFMFFSLSFLIIALSLLQQFFCCSWSLTRIRCHQIFWYIPLLSTLFAKWMLLMDNYSEQFLYGVYNWINFLVGFIALGCFGRLFDGDQPPDVCNLSTTPSSGPSSCCSSKWPAWSYWVSATHAAFYSLCNKRTIART